MTGSDDEANALAVLDTSFAWYEQAARRARLGYWIVEIGGLATAAAIPLSAVLSGDRRITAILGAMVVVLTGLRTIYRWQENWLRFTDACQQLRHERLRFEYAAAPYDGVDRPMRLAAAVLRVEEAETRGWSTLMRPTQSHATTAG